jgi:flavin-binding protein dodecin
MQQIYPSYNLFATNPPRRIRPRIRAVETAARTLRDLRIAEVVKMDMKVENGKVSEYRTRVLLSFKYES